MRTECPNCRKAYDIPDERLPLGRKVSFPCPACKEPVELDLRLKQTSNQTSASTGVSKDLSSGEALQKEILKSVDDLPPMPQVIHKAREVMADPNSSFKDLAIIFVTDQSIAARVLKLANSAYYGLSKQVSSIQQASVVLGHKTLAELITIASTSKLLDRKLKGYELEAGELWQHSLAVAFGSRLLAKKKNASLSDDAFAAGLIHDAGKLVLDKFILERKDVFKKIVENGHDSFLKAEKEILGFDHAEIASEVCNTWNVPEGIASGIRYHHHPSQSQESRLANILYVADGIAMMSGLGGGLGGPLSEIGEAAIESLGFKREDVGKFADQIAASVQKTMQEFQ